MSRYNWHDILTIFAFILIISGLFAFATYSVTNKINTCTRDPIRFGVEEIRDMYDADKVYGTITFIINDDIYTWNFGDELLISNISLE